MQSFQECNEKKLINSYALIEKEIKYWVGGTFNYTV